MALQRKYATLPDLDTEGQELFETPDLTDDNSTAPATTVKSQSDNEFEREGSDPSISRAPLSISQARTRFITSVVDADNVDFSDRVSGKRKSYKVSSRRLRVLDDGTEELGDISDDDDAESLARKVARLKREIEEAKAEFARQKSESGQRGEDFPTAEADIASLSLALEGISVIPASQPTASRSPRVPDLKAAEAGLPPSEGSAATYTVTYAPTYEQSHTLAKAADFDQRLLLVEQALGIGSSAAPELDAGGLPRALIPTLETLGKQIDTLSGASTSSLDSISRRVRALNQEVEALEKQRKMAKAAQDALLSTTGVGGVQQQQAPRDENSEEQSTKINALYGTLPTIENLAPLLPPLLDRLRSLRVIHADAATASETLERIERNQSETAAEIKTWREGLDKIERAMQEADTAMGGNMKVIDGWVKNLEQKVARLS